MSSKRSDLLHEKGYFDYSSILQEAVQALENDQKLRARLGEPVKVVIVDEYQDVNPIQERLIGELHALGAAIKVVGDDDQTIYQWRGSDVGNILTFADRYWLGPSPISGSGTTRTFPFLAITPFR